jgi:hypothetical protein
VLVLDSVTVVGLVLPTDPAAEDPPLELEPEVELEAVGNRGFIMLFSKSPVVPAEPELEPVPVVEPVVEPSPLNISDKERFEDDEENDDDVITSWEEVSCDGVIVVIVELAYTRLTCRGK